MGGKRQLHLYIHLIDLSRGRPPEDRASTFAAFVYSRDFPAMRLRICKSREELLAVLCERRDELNVSHATIDAIAGISDGHFSKLVCERPLKNLGPISLGAILGALGLGIVRIVIEEDPQAAAAVSGRWVPRRRRPNPRKARVWSVVTDVGEEQPSFEFVHREREQGPDVAKPVDNDAR